MDRRTDVVISAVFILFGLFVVVQASTIRTGLFLDPIGPRAFFYGCGAIFVLGGLVNVARHVRAWRHAEGNLVLDEGTADEEGHPASFGRAAAIGLASLLYALAFEPVGYLLATPLYLLVCLRVLGQRNWAVNLAIALLFTVGFYVTFAQGLGVRLPVGPLTTLFRDLGWIIL